MDSMVAKVIEKLKGEAAKPEPTPEPEEKKVLKRAIEETIIGNLQFHGSFKWSPNLGRQVDELLESLPVFTQPSVSDDTVRHSAQLASNYIKRRAWADEDFVERLEQTINDSDFKKINQMPLSREQKVSDTVNGLNIALANPTNEKVRDYVLGESDVRKSLYDFFANKGYDGKDQKVAEVSVNDASLTLFDKPLVSVSQGNVAKPSKRCNNNKLR